MWTGASISSKLHCLQNCPGHSLTWAMLLTNHHDRAHGLQDPWLGVPMVVQESNVRSSQPMFPRKQDQKVLQLSLPPRPLRYAQCKTHMPNSLVCREEGEGPPRAFIVQVTQLLNHTSRASSPLQLHVAVGDCSRQHGDGVCPNTVKVSRRHPEISPLCARHSEPPPTAWKPLSSFCS